MVKYQNNFCHFKIRPETGIVGNLMSNFVGNILTKLETLRHTTIAVCHYGSGYTIEAYLFIYEVMLAIGGKVKLRCTRR